MAEGSEGSEGSWEEEELLPVTAPVGRPDQGLKSGKCVQRLPSRR